VPAIVEVAIQLKDRFGFPKIIGMQLGIVNEEDAQRAKVAGLTVGMEGA
jgi:predicted CoA-binding protein